VFAIIFLAELY